MRLRRPARRSWLLAVALSTTVASTLVQFADGHAPGRTLRGFGTATVDGVLGSGEWSGAATHELEVARPGGGRAPATLFVMNDATTLYLGLRVQHGALAPEEGVYFAFDNDHDGVTESGDDLLFVGGPGLGASSVRDMVIDFASGIHDDTDTGGIRDVRGATAPGAGAIFFELAHPLDTADNAHDVSLRTGQTVGLSLDHHTCLCPGDAVSVWPGTPRADTWADVRIAASVPALAVTEARLQGSWRASRLTGRLLVAGSTSDPAELQLELRSPPTLTFLLPKPVYVFGLTTQGGAFRQEFELSPELVPGSYQLRVTGTSDGFRFPEQARTVPLRGPPEGVVGRAYVSATETGLEVFSLPSDAREIWAHFEFFARPRQVCTTKKVKGKRRRVCAVPPITAVWFRPNGRAAAPAVPKPNRRTIQSFVRSNAALEPGRWHCVLRVGRTLVAEVEAQVG